MDDQLDNDLRDHIKEVFDNYEDTTADEGWLLLREKFPAQKAKRRPIVWLWLSAAAILLAFLSVGLWLKISADKPVNQIVKKVSHLPKHENQPVKKIQPDTLSARDIAALTKRKPSEQNRALTPSATVKTKPVNNYQAVSVKSAVKPAQPVGPVPALTNPVQTVADPARANKNTLAVVEPPKPATKKVEPAIDDPAKAPVAATAVSPVLAQQPKPQKNIMDMFKEDKGNKQPVKDDELKEKKVHFGLYAGTYFNYSKGSDNQVNMGGGVTSDIRLNKNLKLVTGITIAQNSLSYQSVPTVAASLKSNLAVPAPASSGTAMYAPLASTPTIRNYNASLVGLDIPINLKYEFNPQKTDAYISLGLSSGTFIDESYTYKYNYPSFQSSSLKETQNETTGNNFNSFYFAKTLNVAFGVGYPFGKNRLVIEPFLKYPLDGLGSQNLKFGAGGLNLKFNFLSPHK